MILQAYKSALVNNDLGDLQVAARIETEADHAILKYVKIDRPCPIALTYNDAFIETSASYKKRSNERRSAFYSGGANSNNNCYRCGGKGHHQNQCRNVMVDKVEKNDVNKITVIVKIQESQLKDASHISVVNVTEVIIVGTRMTYISSNKAE